MFTLPESTNVDASYLEQKLAQQRDPLQRLLLLDQLTAHYIYTDVRRAVECLAEQRRLLDEHDLPDFLLNYYLHLAVVENQRYDFEAAAAAYKRAMDMLEERGTINQLAEVYIDFVGTRINQNRMEDALAYLERANRLLKNFPDQRLEARATCRHGFMYLHSGNYGKAIELLLRSDRIFNTPGLPLTMKDYYFLTLIHSGLGRIYDRNDEPEKSALAYRKSVQICERLGMRSRLSWHYLNVGTAYLTQGDYENAERYFRRAIDAEDDDNQQSRAGAYANLGYCCLEQERYEDALELFERSEALYRAYSGEDFANFARIAMWRGRLYLETDDPTMALEHLKQALDFAEESDDYRQLALICREIAALYAEAENFREAYEYQVLYDRYTQQHLEQLDKQRRQELEIQYDAAQKQQEAERLQLQASKLQLKALRAQMNPHFLYNALNSIQSYISGNDPGAASRYLAKFAKLMRQSLEYSELESISLEKEIEFLEDYLYINEKLRFEDRLRYEIEVDDEIEEDIIGVPTMIIQPYVENAIEHGLRSRKDGLVRVSFSLADEDTILCTVEDNGIGRERARQQRLQDPGYGNHRSRGTRITERRLQILHHTRQNGVPVRTIDLKDDSGQASGTRVEIRIPIVDVQVK